ncbi:hypothetical protein TCSYLVIO_008480 [Trypanosoma cruzi]|nr:hypothetical protein TCSYLVIO_008480 [Trypanosoma cruzi]
MQHNRALQRRHIRHVDESVRHQARCALAEAANPQLRAARKHAVAQRHVQRVGKQVHRAQFHRHSDRAAEHHRVEARRRPPAANRHGLRQRHVTHAARRVATTSAGPRRRHVERQARVAHTAVAAAAHAVRERRRQRIEARQRSRTAVARHHAHGGQAGHAVVAAALQHPAAGTVALHGHDAARVRRPGDKRRASGSAARNRHGTAAQRHPDSDATDDDASPTAHTSCSSSHPPAPTVPPSQHTSDDATDPSTPTKRSTESDTARRSPSTMPPPLLTTDTFVTENTEWLRRLRHDENDTCIADAVGPPDSSSDTPSSTTACAAGIHTAASVHRRPARLQRPQHSAK